MSRVLIRSAVHPDIYLRAEAGGQVTASRSGDQQEDGAVWTMVNVSSGVVSFQSAHGGYLTATEDGTVVANLTSPDDSASWQMSCRLVDDYPTTAYHSRNLGYLGIGQDGKVVAQNGNVGDEEKWKVLPVAGPTSFGTDNHPCRAVFEKHVNALMAIPGVNGAGLGLSPQDAPAIKVYLEEATAQPSVPASIEGCPICTEVVGVIRAF